MRRCLDALTCFSEFLDCGEKTGADPWFAEIYRDPSHRVWKKKWVEALGLIVAYITDCADEQTSDQEPETTKAGVAALLQ